MTGDTPRPLLSVNNIEVIYDHVILVLKGVSLVSPRGASWPSSGPTARASRTTLKAISGLLRTERGEVTKGAIEFQGQPIHRQSPSEVVRAGIVQVMEGRHVFEHLTVEDNLLTGAYTRRNGRVHEDGPRPGLRLLSAADRAPRRPGRLRLRAASSRCSPSAAP